MSQENVQAALAAADAVARMDLDRLIELTDPEVEWHSFFAQLGEGGGTYAATTAYASTCQISPTLGRSCPPR